MGPSVSAGARDNSEKETHFFPFLSGFGSEPTRTAWFTVYGALGLAHGPLPKAALEGAEGRAGSSSTDPSWALPCSLARWGHCRDGHSTVPPLPIPRQVGGALPWPCQCCPQPFAITPRVVGEAGHKQPLCLRPYYKTQVTPGISGIQKQSKPTPPTGTALRAGGEP